MCNAEIVKLGMTRIWTLPPKLQAHHLANWATELGGIKWHYRSQSWVSGLPYDLRSIPQESPYTPWDMPSVGVSEDSFGILKWMESSKTLNSRVTPKAWHASNIITHVLSWQLALGLPCHVLSVLVVRSFRVRSFAAWLTALNGDHQLGEESGGKEWMTTTCECGRLRLGNGTRCFLKKYRHGTNNCEGR